MIQNLIFLRWFGRSTRICKRPDTLLNLSEWSKTDFTLSLFWLSLLCRHKRVTDMSATQEVIIVIIIIIYITWYFLISHLAFNNILDWFVSFNSKEKKHCLASHLHASSGICHCSCMVRPYELRVLFDEGWYHVKGHFFSSSIQQDNGEACHTYNIWKRKFCEENYRNIMHYYTIYMTA